MKRGDLRTIAIEKQRIEVTFLGKGHYCTAYRHGETVYCFVVEDEYMKDCIVECCEDSPHIPQIKRYEEQQVRGQWRKVYSMPLYRNITAKDKEAWAVLKTLKESAERIHAAKYVGFNPGNRDLMTCGCYFNRDVIEDTRGKIPESVTEALENLADAACNYGAGVCMEFGARNIGVDSEDRIVFRDILFDAEKLFKQRMKASRRW